MDSPRIMVEMTMAFALLDSFCHRRLKPGKVILLYMHDLRKLLTHTTKYGTSSEEATTVASFLVEILKSIA